MNTEKKVIGWKLKEDCKQYEKAAVEVCKQNGSKEIEDFKVSDGTSFGINAVCIDWLKKAGVLELWFEKVYEKEYKVGDYITVISNINYPGHNGEPGKTYKLIKITKDGYLYYEDNKSIWVGDGKIKVRKATKEEIQASQQKVISVGGKFDVTLKDGKIYHKSDDITNFVRQMTNHLQGEFTFDVFKCKISTATFEFTGCQKTSTSLDAWLSVWNEYQELNK